MIVGIRQLVSNLTVNDGDADFDGIPDYADGYDLLPSDTNDNVSVGVTFVPVVFEIPEPIDTDAAVVRLSYLASDPGAVTTNELGGYTLPPGKLRLWARDGSEQRSTNSVWHAATPGDYLPPTPSSGIPASELGFTNGVRTVTFYAEAVRPNAALAGIRILLEVQPDERTGFVAVAVDAVRLTAVRLGLVPDFDRDGKIDDEDKNLLSEKGPFRWWINDDADEEDDYSGSSDIPGQTPGNHSDSVVNGHADLLDFFPVWLDLHDALALLPPGGAVQYKLRQDANALKTIYSDLTRDQANNFLTVNSAVYGPSFDMEAYLAPTFQTSDSSVALSTSFLQKIKDNPNKGILLLEGATQTESPLVLEIWMDGVKIGQTELPLSIYGVEEMYRWHNFRESPTISERLEEPSNRSDEICKNMDVFVAHGFRVPENEARAWGAEFFKRLYQEGMNARFHAVTWSSDTGASVSYEQNVNNAFLTASNYAARVNAIKAANSSEIVVMGHSLRQNRVKP